MFQVLTTSKKVQEGKTQVHPVQLTLEELYHGCLKKVVFQRKKLDLDGTIEVEQRDLVIDVRPGLPDGTRFVFEGFVLAAIMTQHTPFWVHTWNCICLVNCREGNIVPGKRPGAVVFVLETLSHPIYRRQGSDVVHRATVPLFHALQGSGITLQLLSGTESTIPVDSIITPGYTISVPNGGLPLPGEAGKFGNLKIVIDVLFPTQLSDSQKMLMKAAFYLPDRLEHCNAVRTFKTAFQDHLTGWEACVPGKSLK
jgi:DnaJ-class molecular chaperone